MNLPAGTRLGPYELVALAGSGGIGEVYRARDTRLDRTVAVKILAPSLAADPRRQARFAREARAISSLNHPHICALYDVGEAPHPDSSAEHGTVSYLVLEYLNGVTLADRLTSGPLPLAEALRHAIDIADALDKAHRLGIVHRDLKPANVMLTRQGTKLLDFGLANDFAAPHPASAIASTSCAPSDPRLHLTADGDVLGTARYMAPEQAEGLGTDARTDIFAFGALLFEMITGRPAFEGQSRARLQSAILRDQPPAASILQPTVPQSVDRIVSICLAKDPDDRYQSAGDLVRDLKWAASASSDRHADHAPRLPTRSNPIRWSIAAPLTLVLVAAAIFWWGYGRRVGGDASPAAEPVQFTVAAPDGMSFGGPADAGTGTATQVAVAPDGQNIVFVAGVGNSYQIWLRPLATSTAKPIPGTEGGSFPFWSPDSRFIGFFAAGKLKKVPIGGGPPIVLCDAASGRGASWNRDNVILFSPTRNGTGLLRVSGDGGAPTVVTMLDPETSEVNHRWPSFLPDGRHFFYIGVSGGCCPATTPSRVRLASLDDANAVITLFEGESAVTYAGGYLIFARDQTLMAQPFDAEARQLRGDAFPVAEHVAPEGSRYLAVSASAQGTLVYSQSVSWSGEHVSWFDRTGQRRSALPEADHSVNFALSSDDHRLAIVLGTGRSDNREIAIFDLARGVRTPLIVDPAANEAPVWSPDGTRIAFGSRRSGQASLRLRTINDSSGDEVLIEAPGRITPSSWSADGRYLAYTLADSPSSVSDIWIQPLFGDRKAFPLLRSASAEASAAFSPDGRWIAYTSNDGGPLNVFIQPFPAVNNRYQVSKNGGSHPVWRADGKELFYLGPDQTLMAVPIKATDVVTAETPTALFQTSAPRFNTGQVYAVTSDGKQFLTISRPERPAAAPLTVLLNWTSTIRK